MDGRVGRVDNRGVGGGEGRKERRGGGEGGRGLPSHKPWNSCVCVSVLIPCPRLGSVCIELRLVVPTASPFARVVLCPILQRPCIGFCSLALGLADQVSASIFGSAGRGQVSGLSPLTALPTGGLVCPCSPKACEPCPEKLHDVCDYS